MKKNSVLMYLGKLLVCCLVFVAGLVISSVLLPEIAIWPAWMLVARYTAGCVLLGLPLAFLANRMRLNPLPPLGAVRATGLAAGCSGYGF